MEKPGLPVEISPFFLRQLAVEPCIALNQESVPLSRASYAAGVRAFGCPIADALDRMDVERDGADYLWRAEYLLLVCATTSPSTVFLVPPRLSGLSHSFRMGLALLSPCLHVANVMKPSTTEQRMRNTQADDCDEDGAGERKNYHHDGTRDPEQYRRLMA